MARRNQEVNVIAAIAALSISIGIWNFLNESPTAIETLTSQRVANMREDVWSGVAVISVLAGAMYAMFGKKDSHIAAMTAATGVGLAVLQLARIDREVERRAA